MNKGTYVDIDNHSTDSHANLQRKRRKILALTPTDDLFMFNPENNDDGDGKDCHFKLDMVSGFEDPINHQPSTLALTGCDMSSSRLSTYGDKSSDRRYEKKQFCDLDFFKLVSEEDGKESGVFNSFNNPGYFLSGHQPQDNNMNNVTKALSFHKTKYESRSSIICPNASISNLNKTKGSFIKEKQDVALSNQDCSPGTKISLCSSDKVGVGLH